MPCAVDAITTEIIGHRLRAATDEMWATLIKTAYSLHERVLTPSLHFTRPNPRIDFASSPFFVPTAETVDKWNLDKSLAFYKDRFADASDFTFYFVGSFDEATIKPLV